MTHFDPHFGPNCSFPFFFILLTCLNISQIKPFFLICAFCLIKFSVTIYDFWQEGGGVLANFWFLSDKGVKGAGQFLTFGWLGGRRVWTPPFLADIIYEQPLITISQRKMQGFKKTFIFFNTEIFSQFGFFLTLKYGCD